MVSAMPPLECVRLFYFCSTFDLLLAALATHHNSPEKAHSTYENGDRLLTISNQIKSLIPEF
jgi:hypothetical protein